MPEANDADRRTGPADGAAGGSGCVVFLVDESEAMHARVAGGTKSKAESIATALNSLLGRLGAGPALDLALVGYRAAGEGGEDVGPRWGGALAGRDFVSSRQLADAPLSVESRIRKVPGPDGIGIARRQTVKFPVWYVPRLAGAVPRIVAFEHCREMLCRWLSTAAPGAKPPVVVSLVGELSAEETAEALGGTLHELHAPAGPPLVMHAHLGTSDRIPATLYPSGDAHLPPGPIRELFQGAGVLPEPLFASLRQWQVAVNVGARGLIYNARMVDLIRFLSLVKTYAEHQPAVEAAPSVGEAARKPAAPTAETPSPEPATVHLPAADEPTVTIAPGEAPRTDAPAPGPHAPEASEAAGQIPAPSTPEAAPGEAAAAQTTGQTALAQTAAQTALVVLLLDRSVEDPAGGESEKSTWRRLQDHANELLRQIATRGKGRIDSAVVSYGTGTTGQADVQTTFGGPLAGRAVVGDTDLADGALRTEEVTEQVPNGIGGLVSVSRKRPIFVDLEPTSAAPPAPAFAAVKELVSKWRQDHPAGRAAPVVLHMTRGRFEPSEIEAAAGQLDEVGGAALYHLVVTESPHPSLAYVAEPEKIQGDELRRLWELTSPLLGRETLAARRTAVSPQSRGMVINGKFDLLLETVEEALATPEAGPSDTTGKRTGP